MPLFALTQSHGPAWDHNRIMDEQVDWAAHAALMDQLVDQGFIVLGGPLEGTDDVLLVLQADGEAQIAERLSADPWRQNGLLVTKQLHPWRLRLGTLS